MIVTPLLLFNFHYSKMPRKNVLRKHNLLWLGGQQQLKKVNIDSINILGSTVNFQSSVINLGVTIDDPLTMRDHVLRICRTSIYQLRQLRVIRGSLSTETCADLVHAFVSSRLDYCKSWLAGLSDEFTNKIQSVLRSAAHLVLRKLKFDPITYDLCYQLHWPPIRKRTVQSWRSCLQVPTWCCSFIPC